MEQPIEKKYTYEDYLALPDDVRAELIDGELYMMSSPSRIHQDISWEFEKRIGNFLDDKPCKMYHAPFDVHLFEDSDDQTNEPRRVVQPDIMVVCDESKFEENYIKGAPDFIIEILSTSTLSHDRFVKLNLYQQAGVREYWIVSPFEKSVEVLLLGDDGKFEHAGAYTRDKTVKVNVLPGCEIDLSKVFPGEN